MADSTFWHDICTAAGLESIDAVIIGGFGWWSDDDEPDDEVEPRRINQAMKNRLLDAAEAQPLLNYQYDSGYGGGQDCHSVYAWTRNRVIFVHEYDGSTSVRWLPRHPSTDEQVFVDGIDSRED